MQTKRPAEMRKSILELLGKDTELAMNLIKILDRLFTKFKK